MRAAVDGDIILYAVSYAAQNEPASYACRSARSFCENIMHSLTVEGADVFLTGSDNYRVQYSCDVYPYKGNRKDSEKPLHYYDLKQFMIDSLDAVVVDGQEADDTLGILGHAGTHVICTLDKDLDGVPGWHYNWKQGRLYSVSPEDADRFFYTQLLTGDSTDNIPGLYKRVGMKATQRLTAPIWEMDDPADMYEYVRDVYMEGYMKVGICPDDADEVIDDWLLRQGKMLWIRREEEEEWNAPTQG